MTIGDGFLGSGFVSGGHAWDEPEYQAWARNADANLGHVVHIGYHGDSAVSPNWVRRTWKLRDFADGSDATFATFRDRVKSLPSFSRSIMDGEDLTPSPDAQYGTLVLDNADAALDGILALSISGQPVRVFQGDPTWGYASERFRLLFEAVAECIDGVTDDSISIRIRGIEHAANLPIQTTLLPNNTAANAPSNQVWPKSLGNVFNVTPAPIDEANNVYVWDDDAVTSVDQVRVSGVPHQTAPIAISAADAGTEIITTGSAHGFYKDTRVRCPIGTLPSVATWFAGAWNGSMFVAIAAGPSSVAAYSRDGIYWTQTAMPVSANWYSVAWNGNVFCAVAIGGTSAATSIDGVTWTLRTLPSSGDWKGIAWNGTVFCAVGNGTRAATSTDGITWTLRTMPSSANWAKVVWGGGVFCAVAPVGVGTFASATSADGITWTGGGGFVANVVWNGNLAWNGKVFCLVGESGVTTTLAATSTDGLSWTGRTMPSMTGWNGLAWNGSVFVATSYSASTAAATSPDGVTWTASTLPAASSWYLVISSGYVFCAIGAGGTYATISVDGVTWSGTSNSLPTGLSADTDYWCIWLSATTFQLTTTRGGTTPINLTSTTAGAVLIGYHWTADLTTARLYLDSRPLGDVTMDGVAGTTAAGTLLPIILNSTNVDTAMQTRFLSTVSAPVGIFVGDRQNRLDIAEFLMSGLGAWYGYARHNALRMGRIEASYTSHDWDIPEDQFEEFTIERFILPRKQHRLGYRRNWTNQAGQLASGVSAGDRNLFSSDYLITAPTLGVDEGSDGTEFHKLAVKPDYIPSAMTYGSDAQTEALRLDALFYGWSAIVRGKIGLIGSEMEPGQVAKVTHSRFGFGSGVRMPIVGVDDLPSEGKTNVRFRALLTNYAPGAL